MFLFSIKNNHELQELKKLYTKIDKFIINIDNIDIHVNFAIHFSNKLGNITDGIIWNWALNKFTIDHFDNFLKSNNPTE